jgi:hypothetical protein
MQDIWIIKNKIFKDSQNAVVARRVSFPSFAVYSLYISLSSYSLSNQIKVSSSSSSSSNK